MDFQLPKSTRFHNAIMKLASTRPGSWFLSHTLAALDRAVVRLTRGRTSLTTVMTGLPVLTVTTQGARSGKPHAVPLIGMPMGKEVILIASNWGRRFHPAWYLNLKAHPAVTLSYQGQTADYTARQAEGQLREECWARAVEVYAGYEAYRRRAGHRRIPVMVLTPEPP